MCIKIGIFFKLVLGKKIGLQLESENNSVDDISDGNASETDDGSDGISDGKIFYKLGVPNR